MIIQKLNICSEVIDNFVHRCNQSIVSYLEIGGQADAEHVGQSFELS